MEPNKENIKLWAEALESGEYKQGQGCLKRTLPDGTAEYCCLGVATVVAMKAGVHMTIGPCDMKTYENETAYDGEASVLPAAVMDWLGVDYCNPILTDVNGRQEGAYAWNDQVNATFPEIGAMIRHTFLKEDGK